MRVLAHRCDFKNLEGLELAPIASIVQSGVVAITGRRQMRPKSRIDAARGGYARMVGVPVLDHCQDYNLVGNGGQRGRMEHALGLSGWPAAGEEAMVMRNILLAELCDHRIHCQHISAAGSVRANSRSAGTGVKISGEVCPHHIALDGCRHSEFRYQLQDEPAVADASGH